MTTDVAGMIEKLEAECRTGHYTGGGSLWGGEPIMVLRNPDGPEAAALMRSLAERNAELVEGLRPFAERKTMADALAAPDLEWAEKSAEERIYLMGVRKRAFDKAVLRARALIASEER